MTSFDYARMVGYLAQAARETESALNVVVSGEGNMALRCHVAHLHEELLVAKKMAIGICNDTVDQEAGQAMLPVLNLDSN